MLLRSAACAEQFSQQSPYRKPKSWSFDKFGNVVSEFLAEPRIFRHTVRQPGMTEYQISDFRTVYLPKILIGTGDDNIMNDHTKHKCSNYTVQEITP